MGVITPPGILQVDLDGAEVAPIGDDGIRFSAAAEVNREDFGLTSDRLRETGGHQ